MKTKLLLLLLLGWVGVANGQKKDEITSDTIVKKYKDAIDTTNNSYIIEKHSSKDTLIIHRKALRKNLSTIYQSIIPNNQSLNDNTSSFSYTQSNENQKIAIATAYQFGAYKGNFLNIGIAAEGKNGIFNLYSDKSWSNSTSFSIGYSFVFRASQFYADDKKKLKQLREKRSDFVDSLSARIQYSALLKQKELKIKLQEERDKMKELGKLYLKKEDMNEKVLEEIAIHDKKIKEYLKRIEEYDYLNEKVSDDKMNNDVVNKFVEFDLKNDIMYGYNVFWLQINSKLMNNTYTFKEETNKDNSINKNVFHTNISSALMWNMLGKRTLQYATFGISTFRGSYLSSPLFKGITPVYNGDNIINNGEVLGTLNDLNKPIWQYSFNIYYANFFMFKKHLGFNFNTQYINAFKSDIAKNYRENYTVALGPIFKVQGEDDWNKATFGISAGYENIPSKAKANDYFMLKTYVGVPFNVFVKKKSKS